MRPPAPSTCSPALVAAPWPSQGLLPSLGALGALLLLVTTWGSCSPADPPRSYAPAPAPRPAPEPLSPTRARSRSSPSPSHCVPHHRAAGGEQRPRRCRECSPTRCPPAVPSHLLAPAPWAGQRAAWARLLRLMRPLALVGARLPTEKLRKYFRRLGHWPLPSLNPSKLSARARALLSARGPASTPLCLGPAGRGVWVEVGDTRRRRPGSGLARHMERGHGARDSAARRLAARVCALASACGLGCTRAPRASLTAVEAATRRLVRLRRDHDLVLRILPSATKILVSAPTPAAPGAADLRRAVRTAVRGALPRATFTLSPTARLEPGLVVTGDPTRVPRGLATRLAAALCELAASVPRLLAAKWRSTPAARKRRARDLATWLGLAFVDRSVHPGRPRLEHRYVRRHYRDRVFNWRLRADGAYLIRPAMVVIHHTGGLSLRSALYTLTALKLGRRANLVHPKSLAVGVPYLVARDGRIFRLFRDDNRFGRHTIGLNHSAIGVENVGTGRSGLTAAQIRSNVKLLSYLAMRYPLRYLIGHREVYQMARTPYYLEAVPSYCSSKNDPNWADLRRVRRGAAHLALAGAPTTAPLLKDCRSLRRHFRRQRRAANHRGSR